ncbi:hypothetical protein MLD38_013896 [Melastoma candidum]|uniref:Uncharacterized protein n=1 Tax=Melastoma candidum TaxID=119954 RepID=A0ACB9RC79_9MYRT|nr:hypothetical protein MLD38_013896 [Melastoma candidum]
MREIDDLAYVHQAFEGASLEYFLEVLLSDILKEYDGPVVGYRSVLRTVISSFIASYEINSQLEDRTFGLILDILCCIYRGEEGLCIQFWDRESFIDGPIRCLLCNIEGDFPFRITGLVRLLSSLSEGHWPAECAYNFVDFLGISSPFEIDDSSLVDEDSQTVETVSPLPVPGMEGLVIPANTRGHIVRTCSGKTALVRWEHTVSGVSLLLLRLTQELYIDCNEEIFFVLEFFNRMLSFNKGLCFNLMCTNYVMHDNLAMMDVHMEKNMWVVEVISSLVRNLEPSSKNAAIVSMGVNVLVKMIECSPSDVAVVALRSDLFLHLGGWSSILDSEAFSRSWLLSGKLATMLLIENGQHECECSLTMSVLEVTMQLIENGWESDVVLQLIVLSLQYILVNHENWKYKMKHLRWEVTQKVLELMKKCILSLPYFTKTGSVIWDMLLYDSSIHNALFRIACMTTKTLELIHVSRPFGAMEIGELHLAISSVLDILCIMLTKSLKDMPSRVVVFHQAILSPSTKPISVVSAAMSLISYFRYPPIQSAAAKLLSIILMMPGMAVNSDGQQITEFSLSTKHILLESFKNEKLFLAVTNLLASASRFQPAFFISVFLGIDEKNGQQISTNDSETNKEVFPLEEPSRSSVVDVLLKFVKRWKELISSNVKSALAILCILKALWEGASQYKPLLEDLKMSESFWKNLSSSLGVAAGKEAQETDDCIECQSESSVLFYQCQSAILEIMASNVLMDKKLAHAESLVGRAVEVASNPEHTGKMKAAHGSYIDVLSTWHDSAALHCQIKMYASSGYDADICSRAKVATSLFAVHVMGRLLGDDTGCLSNFLVERIRSFYKQLSSQPAFSELSVQYTKHRYRQGKEIHVLILNDLYYHLEGEFRGRKISPGPFKELFLYLADSKIFRIYWQRNDDAGFGEPTDDLYLYDVARLRSDVRLDLWDFTSWKDSKAIAERMLECIEAVNSMTLLCSSKLSALKALVTLLTLNCYDMPETDGVLSSSRDDVLTSINHLCDDIRLTSEQLALSLDTSQNVLEFLSSQAGLLLFLLRRMPGRPYCVCVAALRTSAHAMRVLGNLNLSDSRVKSMLVFSLTLLLALEYCYSGVDGGTHPEFIDDVAEVSNLCLGLLPIFCHCLMIPELCAMSLASMDLILRKSLTPSTWIPIIKEHLHLQYVIQRLQDKNSSVPSHIILKFLLTLAQVRTGAEILVAGGFFYSLRTLFDGLVRGTSTLVINSGRDVPTEKSEKPGELWKLGLSVVTAIIHSLADCSPFIGIMNRELPYLFGNGHLFLYHLDHSGFLSNDPDKKRLWPQRTWTSLSTLEETEHALSLMCTLGKLHGSWVKSMKEVDSQLREKCIHILAFLSRGTHWSIESSNFLCPPESKEEVNSSKRPSSINSRSGWFSITPICCVSKSDVSSASTALVVKSCHSQTTTASASDFSDIVALQIYRIAFLLLKFLCLQAESAAKRAEEVGFVDLAHFPELPMPEILHGLQDQAMSIVVGCCEVRKKRKTSSELQSVCELMLQLLEMALYVELCVLHLCGIRPVLGRVEEFLKQLKLFLAATEEDVDLRAYLGSLRRLVSLVYPGLI